MSSFDDYVDPLAVSMQFSKDSPLYHQEKPYEIWCETAPGIPKSNCIYEECRDFRLKNMRTSETHFDYDTSGFKYVYAPSKLRLKGCDCEEGESNSLVNAYLMETLGLVRKEFGSDQVILFDWRVSSLIMAGITF